MGSQSTPTPPPRWWKSRPGRACLARNRRPRRLCPTRPGLDDGPTVGKFDPSGGPRGTQGCTEAGRFARGRGAVDVSRVRTYRLSWRVDVAVRSSYATCVLAEVLSRLATTFGRVRVSAPRPVQGKLSAWDPNLDQPNPVALRIDNEGEAQGPPRFGSALFQGRVPDPRLKVRSRFWMYTPLSELLTVAGAPRIHVLRLTAANRCSPLSRLRAPLADHGGR